MPIEIRRPSGAIDGIVAHGCDVHLERMGDDMWSLVVREGGQEWRFWLAREGRTVVTTQHGGPVPAMEGTTTCG